MIIRIKKDEAIFILLSIVNILVILFTDKGYLSYLIFVVLLTAKMHKGINNEKFLLYALFIPNKYLQLFAIPLYLLFTGSLLRPRFSKKAIILIIYVTVFGVFNCLVYNGFIISTLFQIGVYYCTLVMIKSFDRNLDIKIAFTIFNKMFYLQFITVILQIIITRGIGDNIKGTLISAHYLGVYLLIYIYMLLKVKSVILLNWRKYINIVLAIAIFILADAKHIFIVFVIAYLIAFVFKKLHIKNRLTVFGICMIIGTILVLNLSQSNVYNGLFLNKYIAPYIYNVNYNKKYMYLLNTMEKMKSWNGVFGFGVGQFGSQISITMSKGIIYDWNPSLSIYNHAIGPFATAINGLMTEWYTTYGILISSMVMGYPLISFVGMVAELGLFGYLLFLNVFDSYFKEKNVTFIIAFLLLTVFDTYLEIPCVFIVILIASYMIQKRGKLIIT